MLRTVSARASISTKGRALFKACDLKKWNTEQLGVLVLLQRKMTVSTDIGGLNGREARKACGKQNLGLTYRCTEGSFSP